MNALCGVIATASLTVCAGPCLAGGPNFSPVDDPEGDVIDLGFGGPLLDLDMIALSYSDTDLLFDVSFYTPIAPGSDSVPESLFGWMEFDTDQNPGTGFEPFQNFYDGLDPVVFGTDFALMLDDTDHPGMLQVFNVNKGPIGMVPVNFTQFGFSGAIPLSLVGMDDGLVDYVIIAGTTNQPTDATNVVGTTTLVPTPGAAACLAIAGIGACTTRRRK